MRKSLCFFFFCLFASLLCLAGALQVKSTQWLPDGALEIMLDGELEGAWAPATRDALEINPSVQYRVIRIGNKVKITGEFQPGTYYEILLKRGFPNASAADGLPEDKLMRFITNDVPANAEWLTSGLFYPLYASSDTLPFSEVNVSEPLTISLSRLYRSSLLHFISSTKVWNGETTRNIFEKTMRFQGIANRKEISAISLKEMGVDGKPGIYTMTLNYGQEKQGKTPAALRLSLTDMSLFLFQNGQNYHCFVYSLQHPDKPCPGVSVYLYSEKQQLICDDITDNNGYVRLSLPPQWDRDDHPHYVVATDEEKQDSVWLLTENCLADPTVPNASVRAMPAILYADRGLCQRGATISFTGLLRKGNGGVCAPMPVEIVVTSPEGEEVFAQELQTDNFGFVSAKMSIDAEAAIGLYHVSLRPPRKTKGHTFTYAEMDFEVVYITFASTDSVLSVEQKASDIWSYKGEVVDIQGRPVSDATVETAVSLDWGDFVPPGKYLDYDFSFIMGELDSPGLHFENKTNKDGVFTGTVPVSMGFMQDGLYRAPLDIVVRSTVRAIENSANEIVLEKRFQHHIFDYYLGIRMSEDASGTPMAHFCAVRPNGEDYPLAECAFDYTLSRYKWEYQLHCDKDGKCRRIWRPVENPVSSGAVELSEDNRFMLPTLSSGNYSLLVKDHATGQFLAHSSFSIGGEDISLPPLNPSGFVFHMDRENYAPGETATISFDSLFSGVAHFLVGAQGSPVKHFHQPLKEGLNTIQVTIPQECSSGACHLAMQAVAVDVSGENTKDVAYIKGDAEIPVNQSMRRVKVGIICPEEVAPGSTVPVQITLTDASGNPVAGRVALWGVEEAILKISGYIHPTPFKDLFENTKSPFAMQSTYSSLYPVVNVENGRVGGDDSQENVFSRRYLMTEYMKTFRDKAISARMVEQVFADVSGNPDEPTYVNLRFPADECQFRLMAVASATMGVGGDDLLVQVKEKVEVKIQAPSSMLPGDKGVFRVSLQNRQSSAEWFPCKLEILTPEYSSLLPFHYEGILNIPMGESQEISQDLILPGDIPAGKLVIRLTLKLSEESEKSFDYAIKIRRAVPLQQALYFQYVPVGATSEPFETCEAEKSIVKIGTLQNELRAHQACVNTDSYNRMEQLVGDLFTHIHLQKLEENNLLPVLAGGPAKERLFDKMDLLPLYRLGNGTYSRYLEGREGWLRGTSQALALEVLANTFCGYPMSVERRQEIIHTLKNFLRNDNMDIEAQAVGCCTLACIGDIDFYPYSLLLLGGTDITPFARYIAGMALVIGGRYAQAQGREEEGQGYLSQGLSIIKELTLENFEATCARNGKESDCLCGMAMVVWLTAMATPADPILDVFFDQFMKHIISSRSMHEFRVHSWLVGAVSQYLLARGESVVKKDQAHALLVRPEDGKVRHTIASEDMPMTVFENGTYCLRNTGKIPLVIIRYKEEDPGLACDGTLGQNFKLTQSFRNASGEEISTCKVGDLVTVRVSIDTPSVEDIVLEYQIPGGFRLEEASINGRYAGEMQLAGVSNAQTGLIPHYLERGDDAFQWFGAISWPGQPSDAVSTAVYEYHLRAVSPGEFHLPPAIATVTLGQVFRKIFTAGPQSFIIEK